MTLPTISQDITTKATQAQVLQALASLAGLPSRQADEDGIDRSMYEVALDGVSRYALSEAVKAIIRGALGHTFFPSPVEFRQQCEIAMEPHYREMERIRIREEQAKANAEFDRMVAARTPEAIARQQSAYARFCEQYEASKPKKAEARVFLDPEMVALVPDAPTTFKRAKVA